MESLLSRTIKLSGLQSHVTEEMIQEMFRISGEIESIKIQNSGGIGRVHEG